MEKKVLGPLVLIVLIIGSTISFGILEMKKQQERAPTQIQPTATPESQQIAFFADNVDANIYRWEAWFLVYGFTDETNLANVVQSLQSLESIGRIAEPKFFNPQPERERFMPFYAEILPAIDSNIETIMEEIEQKGILTELEVYRRAVVKIPQRLTLHSARTDLNISRDHNFEEPFTTSIVSIDSMLGDNLKIRLELVMQGNTVLRETMQGLMKENLSAAPKFRQTTLTTRLSRVEESLGFEENIYFKGFDSEELRESLEDLNGVQRVELKIEKIEEAFTLDVNTASLEDINALKEDINSAFTGVPGVKKIFFHELGNALEARITYDKNKGYGSIRNEAVSAAKSAIPDREFTFIDPRADLSGKIEFSNVSAQELAFAAKEVFLSHNVELGLWQQAYFDVNSLTDPETGEVFFLAEDQQELPVRVEPGSEQGRELNVQLFFQTTREQVNAVFSTELQE